MITALVDPLGFTLVELAGNAHPIDIIFRLRERGLRAYKIEVVHDVTAIPEQVYLQAEDEDGNKRVIGYIRKRNNDEERGALSQESAEQE